MEQQQPRPDKLPHDENVAGYPFRRPARGSGMVRPYRKRRDKLNMGRPGHHDSVDKPGPCEDTF